MADKNILLLYNQENNLSAFQSSIFICNDFRRFQKPEVVVKTADWGQNVDKKCVFGCIKVTSSYQPVNLTKLHRRIYSIGKDMVLSLNSWCQGGVKSHPSLFGLRKIMPFSVREAECSVMVFWFDTAGCDKNIKPASAICKCSLSERGGKSS